MSIKAIDGNYDGKVTIRKNQGISQAIRDEFGLSDKQCKEIGKDGWESIFEEVKKNQPKQYTGGEDLNGDSHSNYTVQTGTTIVFDKDIWNKIVDIVNNKLKLNAAHIDKTAENTEAAKAEETAKPKQAETTQPAAKTEETQETAAEEEDADKDAPAEETTKPGKLTAKDWGRSLWKSTKNFFKKMVCDKDGRVNPWKVGLAAVTTAGAILACSNPVGMMVVGGLSVAGGAVLGVKGIAGIVKGAGNIKSAKTREEKLDALEQTTDGIIETTVGVGMVVGGAKMIKTGYGNYTAAKAAATPKTPATTETPAIAESASTEPQALSKSTTTETPALTKSNSNESLALPESTTKQPTAEEISIAHRRAIAENGTTNPQQPVAKQPSVTSKYNPAPKNPTQTELVYQTKPENPGTFADAKGGDKLAQLRDQVAAEEAAAATKNPAQTKAVQTYENAKQRLADMPKGTKKNPLNAKQAGQKVKAIKSVERAQSQLAATKANRTVTRFSTHSNAEVTYVFKNNNLVEVRIPQGRTGKFQVLSDWGKILKHLNTNGIDEAILV